MDVLPEELRIMNARATLSVLGQAAQDARIIQNRRADATQEVLNAQANAGREVPEHDCIADIFSSLPSAQAQDEGLASEATKQHMMDMRVTRWQTDAPALEPAYVARELHPDRNGENAEAAQAFRDYTAAKDTGDIALAQSVAAQAMTMRSLQGIEGVPNVDEMELAVYRAYVALNNISNKFMSVFGVNVWKRQEINALPYTIRAYDLLKLTGILFENVVGVRDGLVRLPSESMVYALDRLNKKSANLAESVANGLSANIHTLPEEIAAYDEAVIAFMERNEADLRYDWSWSSSWSSPRVDAVYYLTDEIGSLMDRLRESIDTEAPMNSLLLGAMQHAIQQRKNRR